MSRKPPNGSPVGAVLDATDPYETLVALPTDDGDLAVVKIGSLAYRAKEMGLPFDWAAKQVYVQLRNWARPAVSNAN